jgi:pilus assembly protein FimV
MPQSTLPTPSQYEDMNLPSAEPPGGGVVDLELDLGAAAPASPFAHEDTQAFPPPAVPAPGPMSMDLDFSPPPAAPAAPPMRPAAAPVEFDLSGVSLDLDIAPTSPGGLSAEAESRSGPTSGLMDLGLPPLSEGDDPFARKLELAEEFRQIGDAEGARDLLQEVVAKSSGALKSKAQGMLDQLG